MTSAPASDVSPKELEPAHGFRVSPLQWAAVFLGALAIYLVSATPDVQWEDPGQFALAVIRGDMLDPRGLCRVHPLYFLLCTFISKMPWFTVPFACAIISALGGAIAVANVFGIVRELTGQTKAALLAAVGLMVANSFWRFSCYIEVYSLTAALLTTETWCLMKWDLTRNRGWLVAMFFFNGLGLSNHNLALLSLPAIGIVFLIAWARRQASFKTALFGLLAWLLGASIYLTLIMQDAHASNWRHAIHSATVGDFADLLEGKSLRLLYTATTVAFTLLSFPNLMLPAAVLGIFRGRKLGIGPISFFAILASALIHGMFVMRYNVIDQYTFAVPVYALLAVLSGFGFAVVQVRWTPAARKKVLALATILLMLTPLTYLGAMVVLRQFHVLGRFARNKPYREDYRYLFLPWARGEHSANHMSTRAADFAGDHGLIIELNETKSFATEYQLYLRHWNSTEVIGQIILEKVGERVAAHQPVVFVPFDVDQAPPDNIYGHWERVEDLYVLQPTNGLTATTQKAR